MLESALQHRPRMPGRRDFRIGLCGAGGIVNTAHLPAYRKAGFQVAGIYDLVADKAAQTAAAFDIPQVCESLEQLVDSADIIDIAVPATQNRAVVEVVAAAGKAMLVQKPLAEDWQTALATVDTIGSAGVLAAVNQQMRWEPGVRVSRQLYEAGDLGDLFNLAFLIFVDTPWHLWGWLKEKSTVDVLYHSIHYIDAIRYITGAEPRSLFCDGSRRPGYEVRGETRICLHLAFAGELRATVLTNHHASYGLDGQQSEFRVEGTQGATRRTMGILMDYPRGVPDAFSYHTRSLGQGVWRDVDFGATWFPDAFIGPMASLMRALNGEIETPETDVRDNLHTLSLVAAAYRSMEQGQVVELDP